MSVTTTKGDVWSPETWQEAQAYEGMRLTWANLAPGQGCAECDNPRGGPMHFGSPLCESRSLSAKGGTRAHCSCDACY